MSKITDENKNKEMIQSLALKIKEKGGQAYFVGGYVRDLLLGLPNKDYDIEVHNISKIELENILDDLGGRLEFGKSFGIYNIKGYDIDIALPRTESKTGNRHQDFKIDIDPFLSLKDSSMRRDITINAMMLDVLTGEVIDFFHGKDDLKKGIIRHIDDKKFCEDPLRVLRCAQFSARFNFKIAKETIDLCKNIDISTLPKERIFEEIKKGLLKAKKPSIFFNSLREMNQLDIWFPELKDLIGLKQRSDYHLEGDVWNHTMLVIDEANKYINKVQEPLAFMLSCLLHDIGKSKCTTIVNGIIRSYDHDIIGLQMAGIFLTRIANEKKLKKYVVNMVSLHMALNMYAANNSSIKATNKLFDKSVNPNDLAVLSICDNFGRISEKPIVDNSSYIYNRLEIFKETMAKPYVTGSDLLDNGIKPGKDFTKLLRYAHKLRLACVDKDLALKQTLAYYNKQICKKVD